MLQPILDATKIHGPHSTVNEHGDRFTRWVNGYFTTAHAPSQYAALTFDQFMSTWGEYWGTFK